MCNIGCSRILLRAVRGLENFSGRSVKGNDVPKPILILDPVLDRSRKDKATLDIGPSADMVPNDLVPIEEQIRYSCWRFLHSRGKYNE